MITAIFITAVVLFVILMLVPAFACTRGDDRWWHNKDHRWW